MVVVVIVEEDDRIWKACVLCNALQVFTYFLQRR